MRAIRAGACGGQRAVVIGGGLLGLEAARGLRERGAAVTVVQRSGRLMERQLDETGARMLLRILARAGIETRLGAVTQAIGASEVVMDDGEELRADLVVSPPLPLVSEQAVHRLAAQVSAPSVRRRFTAVYEEPVAAAISR